MMISGVGFRIYENFTRPDWELVEGFRSIPTSNINDTMNRLYCMSADISPLNEVGSMVGIAFTVKAPIGDNLILHRALDLAKPGDILIVDGAGARDRSLAGEIMITFAEQKGLNGIVVDGALRDLDGIRKTKMPVYAKAVTPQGPFKNGPGEINVPVCCGGIAVMPGDIIVGDPDGIVVIRPADALEILELSKEKVAKETIKLERYRTAGIDQKAHSNRIGEQLEKKKVICFDMAPNYR